MSIVTKTGDSGETGMVGGTRSPKHAPRMEACGSIDELNALLGVVRTLHPHSEIADKIHRTQHVLFRAGADVATPWNMTGAVPRIEAAHTMEVEAWVTDMEARLTELQWFILPGGAPTGAHLHLARTVCRRAERAVTALHATEPGNAELLRYLNRLGDMLFLLARLANALDKSGEIRVSYASGEDGKTS